MLHKPRRYCFPLNNFYQEKDRHGDMPEKLESRSMKYLEGCIKKTTLTSDKKLIQDSLGHTN